MFRNLNKDRAEAPRHGAPAHCQKGPSDVEQDTTSGHDGQNPHSTTHPRVRQDLKRIFEILCILTAAFELALEMDDNRGEG